jgi:phosphocarrier protein HPr
MIQRDVVISLKAGLHIRPAACIAEKANKFLSDVSLVLNGRRADCKSIFQIIGLWALYDSRIRIIASGIDEKQVIEEICILFECNFNEN